MNNAKKSLRVEITKKVTATALAWALIGNSTAINVYAKSSYSISESYSYSSSSYLAGTSGISEEDFMFAMKNCKYDKNGVLADNAECIWNVCQEYNINEILFVGLIAAESGWCTSNMSTSKKNILSITASGGYKTYSSYADCIKDGIVLLSNNYCKSDGKYYTGGTLYDIGTIYCGVNSAEWCKLIINCADLFTKTLEEK